MNAKSAKLYRLLQQRSMNFGKLATAAQVSPGALSRVLAERCRGRFIWRRLLGCLSDEEQALVTELYGPVFYE